ncbi:MAG: 50S ribosomal protein L9 [Candidatus Vogelbacteria bacterium]|nr:50S ribosomal protein L9 [Candidatus Vogelbacteria bacterium]
MKVILLRDVAGLGAKGEVKEASDGHAKNFLIPRRLAVPATISAERESLLAREKRIAADQKTRSAIEDCIERIAAEGLSITSKANETGHLFAGISREHIAEACAQVCGIAFPDEVIELPRPLKTVGKHAFRFRYGNIVKDAHIEIK